jgi:hypothetical protein
MTGWAFVAGVGRDAEYWDEAPWPGYLPDGPGPGFPDDLFHGACSSASLPGPTIAVRWTRTTTTSDLRCGPHPHRG